MTFRGALAFPLLPLLGDAGEVEVGDASERSFGVLRAALREPGARPPLGLADASGKVCSSSVVVLMLGAAAAAAATAAAACVPKWRGFSTARALR